MSENLPLQYVTRPPAADADGPAPAVFFVHGRGADEEDLLPIAGELPNELHVFSVRAPDRLQAGYTWYELDLSAGGLHASQPDEDEFRRSLDHLHEFVAAAVDTYDLDPDRIGLFGFSQGAIMSLSALLEQPEKYAWVVALNGYLAASHSDPERIEAAAGKPVFVGIGDRDQIIPADRGKQAADTLSSGGLDVERNVYPVGHGTTPQEIRDVAAWVDEQLSSS